MKITSLKINDFRIFKNVEIIVGEYITVLAGSNAVGKSTILGLLGNSCELKKDIGTPILQPLFRCEWSELFKMSPTFDKTKSNVATIYFDNGEPLSYRITWQDKGSRGRLIPNTKTDDGTDTNAKKSWPTLYLGLSRLYPLGEALISEKENNNISISEELITTYKNILSITDEISTANQIHLTDIKKKTSVGVNTNKYDYLTNSAGQDNLAQILLSVESFKLLAETLGDAYQGGLLLIDEIDAALHPSAQNKLLDFLYKSAKKLKLQIVFTTHSISLLDYIILKSQPLKNSNKNLIESYFFTRANLEESPTIIRSPNRNLYTNLLLESVEFRKGQKIKIISEDAEARWLLNKILPTNLLNQVNILDTHIGYNELLSLVKCDSTYFRTRIIVLDGDVATKTSQKRDITNLNMVGNNILLLPGGKSIENSIRDFLLSDSQNVKEYYSNMICLSQGITKIHFMQEDLSTFYNRGQKRDKLKAWFNAYLSIFEETQLFNYWSKEHAEEIESFITSFKNNLVTISEQLYIP